VPPTPLFTMIVARQFFTTFWTFEESPSKVFYLDGDLLSDYIKIDGRDAPGGNQPQNLHCMLVSLDARSYQTHGNPEWIGKMAGE
jgi:hypothetical protein